MMKKILFCIMGFILVAAGLSADEKPAAVSPGSESGMTLVEVGCPTFSWTSVSGAQSYKVAVFEFNGYDGVLLYEDVRAMADPIIEKEINGTALSWTPPADKGLKDGGEYVWFVEASSTGNPDVWSAGKQFKVDLEASFIPRAERLKERLKESGVSEEVIEDVFTDMNSNNRQENANEENNETKAGKKSLDHTTGNEGDAYNNVYYGNLAGYSLKPGGGDNAFFGFAAGYCTDYGDQNTFIGVQSGQSNRSGSYNTFIGFSAGSSNTESDNTFIGYRAGKNNSTGYDNIFIGYDAGVSNTTGKNNFFLGYCAGNNNTTGYDNAFLGYKAGYSNTTGHDNTFLGLLSGNANTIGNDNTFLGYMSGLGNTSGYDNTFIGTNAGISNTTGDCNTFLGFGAGTGNTTGYYNTFIGHYAGQSNTEGHGNVFLGNRTGYSETGSNRLYIDNSDTSSPLIYGEFDNDLLKINGNLRVTGYLSLDNGVTQINSTELSLLDGKTSVSTGSTDNDKLVTKGYVDDHSGGGLTGDYMTNQYICKWDDGNNRLVDSLISENSGNIRVNGGLNINNFAFSLDNGSHWIDSTEINLLDGKTLATGSTNNNILVTKGYVDENDDVGGGGLTGSDMTDTYICKWDDANTRLVDSLISESPGVVKINGKVGIGTSSPGYPMELETTGENAAFVTERTDGATNFMSATANYGQFGTVTNHPARILVNSTWKMVLNTDKSLSMASGASCTAGGVWTNASSIALKNNVQPLNAGAAMETLEGLNPVTFSYKADHDEKHVGFIAEQVPELVASKDRKGLSPMDIVAVLTKVVQEQQTVIAEQRQALAELNRRVAELEKAK